MQPIYTRLRERSRQIVATFPPPEFYQAHSRAHEFSTRFFKKDPAISQLHEFVADNLEDDFGHGLQHAIKVTIDAGLMKPGVRCFFGVLLGLGLAVGDNSVLIYFAVLLRYLDIL